MSHNIKQNEIHTLAASYILKKNVSFSARAIKKGIFSKSDFFNCLTLMPNAISNELFLEYVKAIYPISEPNKPSISKFILKDYPIEAVKWIWENNYLRHYHLYNAFYAVIHHRRESIIDWILFLSSLCIPMPDETPIKSIRLSEMEIYNAILIADRSQKKALPLLFNLYFRVAERTPLEYIKDCPTWHKIFITQHISEVLQ